MIAAYIIAACIIVGVLFVTFMLSTVFESRTAKGSEKYALHDRVAQLKRELDEYQRVHIIGVMQTIDRQLEERKYIPRDELEAYDAMLDVLRRDLRDNKREYNRMEYEYYKESKK